MLSSARKKYKSQVTGLKYTFIQWSGIALLFNLRQELFPEGWIKELFCKHGYDIGIEN